MKVTLLLILISTALTDASRILAVFPVPSVSHQVVFRPLTEALAKRGHAVTVITTDPAFPKGKTPTNLREIDVHDLSYKICEEVYTITSKGTNNMQEQMKVVFEMINIVFEKQIQTNEVQKLIKEETFDLLLIEACARPALVLSHIFKVPVIQVSSMGSVYYNIDTMGSAWHPVLYPSILRQKIYNATKWEQLMDLWSVYKSEQFMDSIEEAENAMAKRNFGPNVPSISELKNNVHMLFLNVHPIWEGNRPTPPSVLYMGGLHLKPANELPEELKKKLDSSKNGVIYMSLGTNVKPSLLPPAKVQMFLKVFSELPYDVLWKWDKDEMPGLTDNIKIAKWWPQADLLRHPKLKVFITQGGLQSTDEAITAGVPLIGIPMLGDQWYNVEKYIQHKIGVGLDMETLTEEQFRGAINDVLGNESYRRNIIKLRDIMQDQPQRPLERAVWWTEHVLRHGGAKHLRAPSANISWAQYLELELILSLFAVLLVILVLFGITTYKICKFASQYFIGKKEKLKKV